MSGDQQILAALTEVLDARPVRLSRSAGLWQLRSAASGAVIDEAGDLDELLARALGRIADAEAARLRSEGTDGGPQRA